MNMTNVIHEANEIFENLMNEIKTEYYDVFTFAKALPINHIKPNTNYAVTNLLWEDKLEISEALS